MCSVEAEGPAIVTGAGEGDGEGCERSAEMLMHTLAPHAGQRAVRVRSSTDMSELKSNELFAPHLQGTYFLSETMKTTPWLSDIARQDDADGTTLLAFRMRD